MLDAFKRLVHRKGADPEWPEVAAWARQQQLGFKRVREEGGGFVLDGSSMESLGGSSGARRSASTSRATSSACAWNSTCHRTCRCWC